MANIQASEIKAGLVTYLNIASLIDSGFCETNARKSAIDDAAVNRDGPFLIVEVNNADGMCLCVPLFGKRAIGSLTLDRSLKTGRGSGWIDRNTYYSPNQFWRVPSSLVVAASFNEMNPVGDRKRYADQASAALDDIAAHKDDSDEPYRKISN